MQRRIELRAGRTLNINFYGNPKANATIFLIHGLGGFAQQWRKQIPVLEDYSLIIPDLYGHQLSDKPPLNAKNPYAFNELALDMQALFERFASSTNIIMGHSYGGAIAAHLCHHNQSRITKLILIAPTPCSSQISIPSIYFCPVFILEWLRPLLEKQFVKLAFNKTQNKELIAEESAQTKTNQLYVIKGLINGMASIPPFNVSTLKVPTLLLVGLNDLLVTPSASTQFYQAIPQLQLIEFKDAAHLIMLEQPIEVNRAILSFLGNG